MPLSLYLCRCCTDVCIDASLQCVYIFIAIPGCIAYYACMHTYGWSDVAISSCSCVVWCDGMCGDGGVTGEQGGCAGEGEGRMDPVAHCIGEGPRQDRPATGGT